MSFVFSSSRLMVAWLGPSVPKPLVFFCVTSIELGIIVVIVHIFTISSNRYSRITTVFILDISVLSPASIQLSDSLKQIRDNSLCKFSQAMHLKNHQLHLLARPLVSLMSGIQPWKHYLITVQLLYQVAKKRAWSNLIFWIKFPNPWRISTKYTLWLHKLFRR